MSLLLVALLSCAMYEYSPTVKLTQVVVGASEGELYLTSDLSCGFGRYRYSIGTQITRCKYSVANDRLLCKNIADDESIVVGLNDTDNDAFVVRPSGGMCRRYGLEKLELFSGEGMSGRTPTEDPLDNNEH